MGLNTDYFSHPQVPKDGGGGGSKMFLLGMVD